MTEALAMKTARPRKPLGHRVWFKIVLAALFFAPAVVETGYDPASTTQLTVLPFRRQSAFVMSVRPDVSAN